MPAMAPPPTPVDGRSGKPAGRALGLWWKRLGAGLGVATSVISMWGSNSTTTAIMLPIALGILGAPHEAHVARGRASGTVAPLRLHLRSEA